MSQNSVIDVQELLTSRLSRFEQKLYRRHIDQLTQDFNDWRRQRRHDLKRRSKRIPRHARQKWLREAQLQRFDRRKPENADLREFYEYLALATDRQLEELRTFQQRYTEFRRCFAHAPNEAERRRLTLEVARDLGASRSQLRGDARAFARWFSDDAVAERYRRRRGEAEQTLVFYLRRLGLAAGRIVQIVSTDELHSLWKRLEIERITHDAWSCDSDPRVRAASLSCLADALEAASPEAAGHIVTAKTQTLVARTATDRHSDVWIQCAALDVLRKLLPTQLPDVLRLRLEEEGRGDDMFLRRRAVRIVAESLDSMPALVGLLPRVARDSSAFVRQQFARCVWRASTEIAIQWIVQCARHDRVPQVRAAALVESLRWMEREDLHLSFLRLLSDVLDNETDAFVLRTAMYVASQWLVDYLGPVSTYERDGGASTEGFPTAQQAPVLQRYRGEILPSLRRLQSIAPSVPVRRWAAQSAERIWCQLDPNARKLLPALRQRLERIRPGASRRIPGRLTALTDEDTLGRLLAVLAQDDFSYDLETNLGRYVVTRGPRFRFRLWRLVYELFHPATDKRQAFRHTIGRVSDATVRAPSAVMGELSETKVPGEPLFIPDDGCWRPFLPLADDFLSVLDISVLRGRRVRFFTAEGVTEVTAPKGPLARLIARIRLTAGFPKYARLRNWGSSGQRSPRSYLENMSKLGFGVHFRPHCGHDGQAVASDDSVLRFFPAVIAVTNPTMLVPLWECLSQYASYFGSAFENSLIHLVVFSVGALFLVLAKHLHANVTLRQARRQVPLSIGGWGTRGKSGTERLKAALLSAMGFGVVSKSTGCEAMFLHCHTHGELVELPLFRPYDKATIWEHRNMILLASRLRSSAFLWECMGLTPAYVDVLQRQWTRDDLATITNTYPDHEDLQGPAGIDVARTISGFVPRGARLLTTEQQMRPLVKESCRRMNSSLRSMGWLESGMITDDVLGRFPYQEHPDNIALVLALAEELGCDPDFALKAMADNMVPDLGVLKTSATARVRTRKLEFTNGMSANERFGCLGNWKRLGFDRHDPHREADEWITTVVNNRADRVARSRVFAQILVNDIAADRHFLIGTNLKGLTGLIWEEWNKYAQGISLASAAGAMDKDAALTTLQQLCKQYHQPTCEEHIRNSLRKSLGAIAEQLPEGSPIPDADAVVELWNEPEQLASVLSSAGVDQSITQAVQSHIQQQLSGWQEYCAMAERIETAQSGGEPALDDELRILLRTWFSRKLIVIENSDATGEQIIHRVCEETPPGYRNRIMGLQNIKGTGLDFVYRWQAWDACYDGCQMLASGDARQAQKGLQLLSAFPGFGQLCEQHLRETIRQVRRSPVAQREEFQAELDSISSKLDESMESIRQSVQQASARRRGLLDRAISGVEEFLDVTDALRRRKKADQIYRDLADERISRQRAVVELRDLNKRQKGGWLAAAFGRYR